MSSPAEATDDMSEPRDGFECRVQARAAHGVVDDIEAFAAGMPRHIRIDVLGGIVDRRRSKTSEVVSLGRRIDTVDVGSQCDGDLHSDMPHATARTEYEDRLSSPDVDPVDEALPCGDEDEWQRRCLAHREIRRLDDQ